MREVRFLSARHSVRLRQHTARSSGVVALAALLAACGADMDVVEIDDGPEQARDRDHGGVVAIDAEGNEVSGSQLAELVREQVVNKATYGSYSSITNVPSIAARIPDGLGAPTDSAADLNCMFEGSGSQCWFPAYPLRAIQVCFHPDNQDWFDDVVRDVLNVGGTYFGNYTMSETAWTNAACDLVAEERFETGGAYGQGPVVYLNTTQATSCGPSSANTCLFYGRAAFRIWTQAISEDYGGFPGNPFRDVLEKTIHHEVGHVLGLQHNNSFDPTWGHASYMRQATNNGFETFFNCELAKLNNYHYGFALTSLTRYSPTANTASCTD